MKSTQAYDTLTGAGFQVEDKRPERDYFVIRCKACGERWSLGIRPVATVHAEGVER